MINVMDVKSLKSNEGGSCILVDSPDERSLWRLKHMLPPKLCFQPVELAVRIHPRTYRLWQPNALMKAMDPCLLLLIVQHHDSDWELCRRSAADFASIVLGIALKIIDFEGSSP